MTSRIRTDTTPSVPTAGAGSLNMTYEAFLDRFADGTHAEWVAGEVVVMSPVSEQHQSLGRFLLALLTHFTESHERGVVLYDPFQMKTDPDLPGRAPDLLFVAEEHCSRLHATFLEGPADLVVEIISPESRARDRGEKFYEYEQGGVREYWLVDPQRRQAAFHALGEDGIFRVLPVNDGGVFHSRVLDGLWFRVEWLWQQPLPRLLDVLRQWGLV